MARATHLFNVKNATTVAIWPHYLAASECWVMYELVVRDGELSDWEKQMVNVRYHDDGRWAGAKAVVLENFQAGATMADDENPKLLAQIDHLALPPEIKQSLKLKVEKRVTAKRRLQTEEVFMLAMGIQLHSNDPRPDLADIKVSLTTGPYKDQIHAALQIMPYLRVIRVFEPGKPKNGPRLRALTLDNPTGPWLGPFDLDETNALHADRALIANAFGYRGRDNWAKTKAAIRLAIDSKSSLLLQMKGVQRILHEAKERGEYCVVIGDFVFWFEPDSPEGWTVKKIAPSTSGSDADTVWHEGTIISKNFGRLVILPYIKVNGERVHGHTRNAPYDGISQNRPPGQEMIIPFKVYTGDLTRDLLGNFLYK